MVDIPPIRVTHNVDPVQNVHADRWANAVSLAGTNSVPLARRASTTVTATVRNCMQSFQACDSLWVQQQQEK